MVRPQLVHSFTQAALSPDPDLAVAALMIARLAYPKLDARPYLDRLDEIGREAAQRVSTAARERADTPAHIDPQLYARVMALNDYLFGELRFVGNDVQYQDPRNSFLNDVIERRTGIPITLALVYIEVARRAGLTMLGVNFPGHFLVRCPAGAAPESDDLIIDAHHGGAVLSRDACLTLFRKHAGPDAAYGSRVFVRATKPQILVRMLLNLKHAYVHMRSFPQARDATELLLALDPSAITELRDRGLLAYHLNDFQAALRDLQAYLRLSSRTVPDEAAREEQARIWGHVKTLRRRVASLN